MAEVSSKELYKFKKTLKELSEKKVEVQSLFPFIFLMINKLVMLVNK